MAGKVTLGMERNITGRQLKNTVHANFTGRFLSEIIWLFNLPAFAFRFGI